MWISTCLITPIATAVGPIRSGLASSSVRWEPPLERFPGR
jgi:hypothetical protein